MTDDDLILHERRRCLGIVCTTLTAAMKHPGNGPNTVFELLSAGLTIQNLIGSGLVVVDAPAALGVEDEPRVNGRAGGST